MHKVKEWAEGQEMGEEGRVTQEAQSQGKIRGAG